MRAFAEADVLVDGSATGWHKPDPRAFRAGLDALGLPAERVLFLDDQPVNLAGARDVGLQVLAVDVTDPDTAFTGARRLLRC
jgi:putative hydrolase of the HAD superfamily